MSKMYYYEPRKFELEVTRERKRDESMPNDKVSERQNHEGRKTSLKCCDISEE